MAGLALTGVDAQAQTSADLSGRWRINGNGHPGDLVIAQASDGLLSGSMYGNPISGYMAAGARQAVILRGPPRPPGAPDQVYLATLAPDERTMSGTFYAFNTVNGYWSFPTARHCWDSVYVWARKGHLSDGLYLSA